jgi:hypothetical protein
MFVMVFNPVHGGPNSVMTEIFYNLFLFQDFFVSLFSSGHDLLSAKNFLLLTRGKKIPAGHNRKFSHTHYVIPRKRQPNKT